MSVCWSLSLKDSVYTAVHYLFIADDAREHLANRGMDWGSPASFLKLAKIVCSIMNYYLPVLV